MDENPENEDETEKDSSVYLTPELTERHLVRDKRKLYKQHRVTSPLTFYFGIEGESLNISTDDEDYYYSSGPEMRSLKNRTDSVPLSSMGHGSTTAAGEVASSPRKRRQQSVDVHGNTGGGDEKRRGQLVGSRDRVDPMYSKPKESLQETSYASPDHQINLSRPTYTVNQLRHDLCYQPKPEESMKTCLVQSLKSFCSCSMSRFTQTLFLRIPILLFFTSYSPKKDLAPDVIAGLTVAVMHVPQGMAYAMLAEVPPINGLYTAFFPVLAYAWFGTSKHISVGTFAVACLMTGKVVGDLSTPVSESSLLPKNFTAESPLFETPSSVDLMGDSFSSSEAPGEDMLADSLLNTRQATYTPVEVAAAVSFTVGIWQFVFGFLQLGQMCVFLSDMLISGFTTGAACHVFSSQIKHIFGIQVPRYSGPFRLIYTYVDVLRLLPSANVTAVIISLICLTILIINNEFVKPRVKKICNFPIPIELIIVILGTIVAFFGDLENNNHLNVVGDIPTGLPYPTMPETTLFPAVIFDSLVIAVVVYTISFSMAKMFSIKHKYTVDATQELHAHGLSNIFGSLFSCVPSAASMSRSLIQESVGCMTQMTSFVSCMAILLILLFVGPAFSSLPTCVLASIILVSLKGMFLQIHDFFAIWKKSPTDSMLWLITFVVTVLVDIDYGLVSGVLLSLVLLIKRSHQPTIRQLGWLPATDIYVDIDTYHSAIRLPSVVICEVTGSLHFANRDAFKSTLISITGVDPAMASPVDSKSKQAKMNSVVVNVADSANEQQQQPASLDPSSLEANQGSLAKSNGSSGNLNSQGLNEELLKLKENLSKEGLQEGCQNFSFESDEVFYPSSGYYPFINFNKVQPATVQQMNVSSIVLNLSGVGWVDVSAGAALANLYKEYNKVDINLSFAGINDSVMQTLKNCGALLSIPENRMFFSLHDAVSHLLPEIQTDVKTITARPHDARPTLVPQNVVTSTLSKEQSSKNSEKDGESKSELPPGSPVIQPSATTKKP